MFLPYFHTWCGLGANLRCRSETCCTGLAENTGRKNSPKNRHQGTIAQLCRTMSSQLRHLSTIGKKWLSSNISCTCSHNMVNFGPLTAKIGWEVWGTPANFNGFRVFAALLHVVTGQLADTPTRGLPTRGLDDSRTAHLADWSTRGLDNSRTGQVADWTTRGCHRRLCVLSFYRATLC